MSEDRKQDRPSDETLVAFIDRELGAIESADVERWIAKDAEVAARFDFLTRSSLPFAEAFAPLLERAPEGLDAMLASLPSPNAARARQSGLTRRGFFGMAAACLVAGIAIDRAGIFIGHKARKTDESEHWRAVVAEYLELYTPDTLSSLATDRPIQVAQLATVGGKMGIPLTPEAIALPGAEFRRAQLLQYDGEPLAQLAYLDPATGPLALCFVPSDAGRAELRTEQRRGMNVVFWSTTRHAFMLIGHAPFSHLEQAADGIMARLPA